MDKATQPPPQLTWRIDDRGTSFLMYKGVEIGSVRELKPMGRRTAHAAWQAGCEDLGVPDSGVHEAGSLESAKRACHFWVTWIEGLRADPLPARPEPGSSCRADDAGPGEPGLGASGQPCSPACKMLRSPG